MARIDEARLKEIAERYELLYPEGETASMARGLLALRQSHARLVEALEGWQDHLTDSLNCMDAKEQALFFAARAALAEAEKLEGSDAA